MAHNAQEKYGYERSTDYLRDESLRWIINEHMEAFVAVAAIHDQHEDTEVMKVLRVPELLFRRDMRPTLGSSLVQESFGNPIEADPVNC